MFKIIKWSAIGLTGCALAGGFVFGKDAFSYITSGTRSIRSAIKDSVPIDFQIRRAHDLVADIVPEMQANVRLIAQQEVEIENLRDEIAASEKSIGEEKLKVAKLRDSLDTTQVSYNFGSHCYTRDQVKQDLARRFDSVKEAEVVLAGKKRLLDNREKSLSAAQQMLEKARTQKSMLESQIATLEGQYKLIQAAGTGSDFCIDDSKLEQSRALIEDIKKQLDVAERVLAHESKFTDPIQVDAVSEKELVLQVDDYLKGKTATAAAAK